MFFGSSKNPVAVLDSGKSFLDMDVNKDDFLDFQPRRVPQELAKWHVTLKGDLQIYEVVSGSAVRPKLEFSAGLELNTSPLLRCKN